MCNVFFYLWTFVVFSAKCFYDFRAKEKRFPAENFRQHSHNCIPPVPKNTLEVKKFKEPFFWLWVKMFRSLRGSFSALFSKPHCAIVRVQRTFKYISFEKPFVFVRTSSWRFWDFQRTSLDCDGKCFSSVLKIDFYLIRGTLWAKCFERFCEYKPCPLTLSERLFDTQQKFFVTVLKTAFHLSRGTTWKYFVSFSIQLCFWHRDKLFRSLIRSFQQCSQNCISQCWTIWWTVFFKILCLFWFLSKLFSEL